MTFERQMFLRLIRPLIVSSLHDNFAKKPYYHLFGSFYNSIYFDMCNSLSKEERRENYVKMD